MVNRITGSDHFETSGEITQPEAVPIHWFEVSGWFFFGNKDVSCAPNTNHVLHLVTP